MHIGMVEPRIAVGEHPWPHFDVGIGKLHRNYGDMMYCNGLDVHEARLHWRTAARLGALGGAQLRWRLGKSYVPVPVLKRLRSMAGRLRAVEAMSEARQPVR